MNHISMFNFRLSGVVREHGDMGYLYCDGGGKGHSNSPTMQSLSNLSHEDHVYEQPNNGGCQEITDIPDDYLSQSQVIILVVLEYIFNK